MEDDQLDLWAKHLKDKVFSASGQQRDNYKNFLTRLAERLDKDKDAVIVVTGQRGTGKSTFALVSAMILKTMGLTFDFKHVFVGTANLKLAMQMILNEERSVFVFDEIIEMAYSRDAMTLLNRRFVKILTQTRKLHNIYFLCLPRLRSLDPGMRNDIVDIWVHVFWKSIAKEKADAFAMATIHLKDLSVLSTDPWGLDIPIKKWGRRVITSPVELHRQLKSFRTYIATLSYPPLPDAIQNLYMKQSVGGLKEIRRSFDSREDLVGAKD